jgi:uncharacterized repeat protein (TIGR03803 family)
LTPSGKFTTLHNFDSTDGAYPLGALQLVDGNLYGTTSAGGPSSDGTIYRLNPTGTLTTLQSFDSSNGGAPVAGIMQGTSGVFFGTTLNGGSDRDCEVGCGTVFSLSMDLKPFVAPVPTSGKVGAKVVLLGNNLTDATSVTFNGVAATFEVVSSTEILTSVPTDATTGIIEVTIPAATLNSNSEFRIP